MNKVNEMNTATESKSQHDLEIIRILKAPRRLLWRAWSDPKLMAEWWCPKPWKTEVKAFDFRPGGAFHTYMTGPDGGVSDNPGCFLEIVPEQRIVGTSMLTGDWRPASPWIGITSIFSMEDADGGTRYTARCMHRTADESRKHEEMGFYEGWGIMIDQLDEFARGLKG
jgi:uncharacterized protein YndB with AHSA1/START domain